MIMIRIVVDLRVSEEHYCIFELTCFANKLHFLKPVLPNDKNKNYITIPDCPALQINYKAFQIFLIEVDVLFEIDIEKCF